MGYSRVSVEQCGTPLPSYSFLHGGLWLSVTIRGIICHLHLLLLSYQI